MRTATRWFWRRPGRLRAGEFHAAGHLALAHLGRNRRDRAGVALRAVARSSPPCRADVARVALGHLELDLEGRQVDDRQQRRVLATVALCVTARLATMPSTGERTVSASTRRWRLCDHQRLAVALQPAGLQVEFEAVLLEAGRLARVVVPEPRLVEFVLRPAPVALADHRWSQAACARANSRSAALICTLARSLGLLAPQHLAADLDLLAREAGVRPSSVACSRANSLRSPGCRARPAGRPSSPCHPPRTGTRCRRPARRAWG